MVSVNEQDIVTSMENFIKVNNMVYEEWSTEKRRRGLEEGRLVSGKNKVIEASKPVRQQWSQESIGMYWLELV